MSRIGHGDSGAVGAVGRIIYRWRRRKIDGRERSEARHRSQWERLLEVRRCGFASRYAGRGHRRMAAPPGCRRRRRRRRQ
jgi:hypothetical protein